MSFPVETTSGEIVQIKDIETVDPTRPMEGKVYIAEDGKRYRPPAGTNQYLVVEEIPEDEEPGAASAEEPASPEALEAPPENEGEPDEAPPTPGGVDAGGDPRPVLDEILDEPEEDETT